MYPPDPVLLDRVSETNQTLFQLEPEIRLLYYDEFTGRDFPLPFDLDKYFRLLDVSRALHPWRELAPNAPALSVQGPIDVAAMHLLMTYGAVLKTRRAQVDGSACKLSNSLTSTVFMLHNVV